MTFMDKINSIWNLRFLCRIINGKLISGLENKAPSGTYVLTKPPHFLLREHQRQKHTASQGKRISLHSTRVKVIVVRGAFYTLIYGPFHE